MSAQDDSPPQVYTVQDVPTWPTFTLAACTSMLATLGLSKQSSVERYYLASRMWHTENVAYADKVHTNEYLLFRHIGVVQCSGIDEIYATMLNTKGRRTITRSIPSSQAQSSSQPVAPLAAPLCLDHPGTSALSATGAHTGSLTPSSSGLSSSGLSVESVLSMALSMISLGAMPAASELQSSGALSLEQPSNGVPEPNLPPALSLSVTPSLDLSPGPIQTHDMGSMPPGKHNVMFVGYCLLNGAPSSANVQPSTRRRRLGSAVDARCRFHT